MRVQTSARTVLTVATTHAVSQHLSSSTETTSTQASSRYGMTEADEEAALRAPVPELGTEATARPVGEEAEEAGRERAAATMQAAVRGSARAWRPLSAREASSSPGYSRAVSAHDEVVLGSGLLGNSFPDAPPTPRQPSIDLGQIMSSGGTMTNVFAASPSFLRAVSGHGGVVPTRSAVEAATALRSRLEAPTANAEPQPEPQPEPELQPEPEPHTKHGSSSSSYQRLASSEEVDALRAVVSTLQADVLALKAPQPSTKTYISDKDDIETRNISLPSKSTGFSGLEEATTWWRWRGLWSQGPPLLSLCMGGGCIQDASTELSNSIYFISLLRVISLLKATMPSTPRRTSFELAQAPVETSANTRRRLAAAGWATLLVIAAMCQIFLIVLILETSTSSTCNVEHQTGCRPGEYCSFSIAKGQCNDCSVVLSNTTTCCPTLGTFCPSVDYRYNETYFHPELSGLCGKGCPHACVMYQHCISERSWEILPRRCDFLVNGRNGVKWSHIFLLIFGAVLWASNLISVLDETDMMIAALPEAAMGEERSTHNAIVMLFRFIFVFRSCALPALTAAGAVVRILTDAGGASLTGGASAAVEPVIAFASLPTQRTR